MSSAPKWSALYPTRLLACTPMPGPAGQMSEYTITQLREHVGPAGQAGELNCQVTSPHFRNTALTRLPPVAQGEAGLLERMVARR